MSETTNYGLYITDDSTERFQDARRAVYGVDNSNMVKIDAIMYGKAGKSVVVTATLDKDEWVGNGAIFTQAVAVDGMTTTKNGNVFVSPSASDAENEAARLAFLKLTAQADDTVTITAYGEKPTLDIPIVFILID